MSWGTIAFEAGFPLLVSVGALTPWLLAVGVVMHLTIGMLMDVGPLGTVALSMYPVLLDPDAARRLYERARIAWVRRR